MAGPDAGNEKQFTGISKYFNSHTTTGRKNWVIATYTTIAAIVLYFKFRPKKQPAVTEK